MCNIDQAGNTGANIDPGFVSPGRANNYHLKDDSPVIDACNATDIGTFVDLEDYSRPIGNNYDMSAFESKLKSFLPLVIKNG